MELESGKVKADKSFNTARIAWKHFKMPYEIYWEERGVVMQYRGHTSDEEIAEAVRIAQADKRFDSIKYDIHDFRLCEEFGFSQPKICEIAAIDGAAALSLPHKQMAVAVVTDRPDVIASVNAYVSSGFNVHSVHICSSIDEARDWLSSVLKA